MEIDVNIYVDTHWMEVNIYVDELRNWRGDLTLSRQIQAGMNKGNLVWKAGFEPAASRFQSGNSDQTELLPDKGSLARLDESVKYVKESF